MKSMYTGNADINQDMPVLLGSGKPCSLLHMNPICERIDQALKRKGMKPYRLAKELGITPQSVYEWVREGKPPDRKRMKEIARVLEVSPAWLEFGDGPDLVLSEPTRKDPNVATSTLHSARKGEEGLEETHLILKDFPLISWVQAGEWSEIVDNFQPGDAEMWVPFGIPRKDMPNAFCLRVRGDSMIPEFADGDIILVDPHRQPENGSFVIAKLLDTQEATFKKYVVDAGNVSLLPLNFPKYEPIRLNGRKAVIVGVVVGKQKMY